LIFEGFVIYFRMGFEQEIFRLY